MPDLKRQKKKLLDSICTKNCCATAFLVAVFKCGLSIVDIDANKIIIKNTDKDFVKKLKNTIFDLYGNKIVVSVNKGKTEIFGEMVMQMLLDCGVIFLLQNSFCYIFGIDQKLLEEECCKITFLKTIFYLTGNLYLDFDAKQNTKGYSLEFSFKEIAVTDDVQALMKFFNLNFKHYKKNDKEILYCKNSETIFDFFVVIDAVELSLLVQDSLTMRIVKNEINRQSNCYEANINKTVNASFIQTEAIKNLQKTGQFELLSADLKEIALLRFNNPQDSLTELQKQYGKPITRAGIKYKLDKILKIYKSLKG